MLIVRIDLYKDFCLKCLKVLKPKVSYDYLAILWFNIRIAKSEFNFHACLKL